MRFWLVFLVLVVGSPGFALDMRQSDKQLHFLASYGANMTIHHFTKNIWISSLATLGIGAIKELIDTNKSDSWDDLQADALGVGASALVLNIEF